MNSDESVTDADVWSKLLCFFDNNDEFIQEWLNCPCARINYTKPIVLLKTPEGRKRIVELVDEMISPPAA